MASTKLTRNHSGAPTSRKKMTWSWWIKRSKLGATQYLYNQYRSADSYNSGVLFQSDDSIRFWDYGAASNDIDLQTTRLFRDDSAWYHIVLAIDTTQGTASNRVKLYVNGVQETAFDVSTYPSQDHQLRMGEAGSAYQQQIGFQGFGSTYQSYFDGVMSHVHYVDGTQYAASDFGSTDSTTGEWKINTNPNVTYGNNGFFILKDGNSVTDSSSNSNAFTVSAGTLTKTEDCPSNNFATFNPLNKVYMNSIANGNTTIGAGNNGTDYGYISATIGASSGKYYWEAKVTDLAEIDQVGVALASSNFSNVFSGNGLQQGFGGKSFQFSNGNKAGDGSQSAYMGAFSANDIMMVALDLDNNKITFGRNGQWADGSGNANQTYANSTAAFTNLTAGETYIPAHAMRAYGGNTGSTSYNFGNGYFGTTAVSSAGTNASNLGIFEYDVPSGFTALCTKGLNE